MIGRLNGRAQDRIGALLPLVLLTALLGACRPSPEVLWQRADAALGSGDFAAASIDLKSLLQSQPDNAAARAALARAALALGDVASAEKEIRRALSLQPATEPGDGRQLVLAEVLLSQRRYDDVLKIIADFSAADPASAGDALMLAGRAFEAKGDDASAEARFRAAIGNDARRSAPRVALINLLFRANRLAEGDALIAEALALDADDIPALVLQGRRLIETRGVAAAETHFTRVLARARGPDAEAEVLVGLAEIQLQRGRLDEADKSIKRLEEITPGGLLAYFLRSRHRAQQGQYADAIARLQQILKADSEFLPAERLLGTVQYLNGNFEQAAMHIQRVVSRGADPFLSRLLAELRLRQNKPEEALQTLLPMMRESPGAAFDQGLLVLAGQASLTLGDHGGAGEYFRRGQEQFPDDERFRLGEISARLASGDTATARTMLASLRASTANRLALDYLGVVTELAERKFPAAEALEKRLVDENPDVTWSHLLLATVHVAQEEFDAARREFERVMQMEPANKEALINLARLDFRAGDDVGGEARLQQVIEADPDDFRPRLLLSEAHLVARRYNQALDQARAAMQLAPDSPVTLNLLARASAANGRWDTARESFARITLLDPKNPRAWLNLARATVAAGKSSGVPDSLLTAMALAPRDPVVLMTAGDLHVELRDIPKALESYRTAWRIEPSGDVAIRLCRAELAKRTGDVCAELRTWVTNQPDDLGARLFKATVHQGQGDAAAAIREYEIVLSRDQRQVQALNNLAWLLFEKGDPRARELAERALAIQPESAAVLDTLGWIVLRTGDKRRGLELITAAARRSPRDPELQYHLAAAMADNGDRPRAQRTLDTLLESDARFASREAAERLRRSLAVAPQTGS